MKIKIKDAFKNLKETELKIINGMTEATEKGQKSFDGYRKLAIKKTALIKLMQCCDLEMNVPKHMEKAITWKE
jgi:hypothetical protein